MRTYLIICLFSIFCASCGGGSPELEPEQTIQPVDCSAQNKCT